MLEVTRSHRIISLYLGFLSFSWLSLAASVFGPHAEIFHVVSFAAEKAPHAQMYTYDWFCFVLSGGKVERSGYAAFQLFHQARREARYLTSLLLRIYIHTHTHAFKRIP